MRRSLMKRRRRRTAAGEKTAAELRIAYSRLNKLLTVANQGRHHESILK